MKRISFAFSFLVAAIVLHGCAHKVAPSGGEKDVKPPVLLSASPENYQVNFSLDKILLTFDEYVQLQDVQKQLLISPPLNPVPQIESRKKSIVITFADSLKTNTTYTMNFGNAISDFTEANPFAGFQYVFSTGPLLDSLVVTGWIQDALTLKPSKGALAILYSSETPDSMIGITPPHYYARCGDDGRFTIRNIRKGSYRVFGLADNNNNNTAEFANEAIGSGTELIDLADSISVSLVLALQPALKQSVKSSSREAPGKLTTVFARPLRNPGWKFAGSQPLEVIPEFSFNRDTVILYCFPGIEDSAEVIWSENMLESDTVLYRSPRVASPVKISTPVKATGIAFPRQGGILAPEIQPTIKWNAPLISFDFGKVKVFKDSVEFPVRGIYADTIRTLTVFEADWNEGSYNIVIPAHAVNDRYGSWNDTIQFAFSVPSERTKGSISFKCESSVTDKLLLQLVNEKDELVRQRVVNGRLDGIFERVDPGAYRLRVVFDTNNNDRWDAGEILKNIRPEKVLFYKDSITVRANWEVEIDWVIEVER